MGINEKKLLKAEFLGCPEVKDEVLTKLAGVYEELTSGKEDFTGWVTLPGRYDEGELARVIRAAERIRKQSNVLVVIGIGGSYLGARAALEMLRHSGDDFLEIVFAGQNISGVYHGDLLDRIQDRDISLCVVSKSGTTTEPNIAFAVFKDLLIRKYGKAEAAERIFAITDPKSGTLRAEADAEGYESFEIPSNIGGRYSVLTPVGLLPIAAGGIDVKAVFSGAARAMAEDMRLLAARVAATRKALLDGGKLIEVLEQYEPSLFFFTEWMKQLYGESEGKDGRGLFPAGLSFSTDLHSMGQYLQEGNQIFFETVLDVKETPRDIVVPQSADPLLAGKRMNDVNRAALEGVIAAHRSVNIPVIKVDIPDLSPYTFGEMVYFFELVCAFTGKLMGVDPFNQPGVEQYKREMKSLLGAK